MPPYPVVRPVNKTGVAVRPVVLYIEKELSWLALTNACCHESGGQIR